LRAWLDLRRRGKGGTHRYVAVVFDDGWRDNYEHALGPLTREAFPASIFLVVDAVNQSVRFWADVVADLYFSVQRASALARLAALLPEFPISRDVLQQDPHAEGLAKLISGLKANPDAAVETALGRILSEDSDAAACVTRSDDREFLNWDEVSRMAESELIDFGSHTMTHQRLDSIDDEDRLRSEVVASHDAIRSRLGLKFNEIFCYPNGNISPRGAALVRDHYNAACTTHRGVNGPDSDVYSLSRINVHRDIASTATSLLARLY
jgi:peptidoglycan/xylan/chitin deacetylase (PgdA/CDA1 family)